MIWGAASSTLLAPIKFVYAPYSRLPVATFFNSTLDISTIRAHLSIVVTSKALHAICSMSRQAQGWLCALNPSTTMVSFSCPEFGTKEDYKGG